MIMVLIWTYPLLRFACVNSILIVPYINRHHNAKIQTCINSVHGAFMFQNRKSQNYSTFPQLPFLRLGVYSPIL